MAGARQDTRAKNREALYAISTALERVGRRQQELRARPAAEGVPAQQQQQGKKKKKRREAEAVLPNLVVVKEVGPEGELCCPATPAPCLVACRAQRAVSSMWCVRDDLAACWRSCFRACVRVQTKEVLRWQRSRGAAVMG